MSSDHDGGYGGLGVYRQQSRKTAHGRRKLLVALTVTAVLVITGAAVAALNRDRAVRATPMPVSGPTTTSLEPLDPRTPGWQTVISSGHAAAYDVPKPRWSLHDPDSRSIFTSANGDLVADGTGVAEYMSGYCTGHPDSWHAISAVSLLPNVLQEQAAPQTATQWAKMAYTWNTTAPPEVAMEPPRSVPVSDGTRQATLAVADVTVHRTNLCGPKTAKAYVAAVSSRDRNVSSGSTVLVLLADQDVPDALSDVDAMRIMTSLRPGR